MPGRKFRCVGLIMYNLWVAFGWLITDGFSLNGEKLPEEKACQSKRRASARDENTVGM